MRHFPSEVGIQPPNGPKIRRMNAADLRQEYMRAGLSEAQADRDPIRQFETWFQDALSAQLPLPNAMTLATVSAAGAPSARVVLLKGVESGGFVLYANICTPQRRRVETAPAAPARVPFS